MDVLILLGMMALGLILVGIRHRKDKNTLMLLAGELVLLGALAFVLFRPMPY